MFNNASNIDASHSTFSEVHRDQHIYSRTHVQGNQSVNTIVHGNQVFQGTFVRPEGLENLYRASVPGAAFDSFDRHPAPTCLPGTRLGLLARITEWVENTDCDQRLCWLSGPAGSGKSAIAQSVAEKYASQRRLAASFFFSRKEILRRRAQGFFPTLACQMLVSTPSIRPSLLDALETDATIPNKVLLEQARKLLQEPVESSVESFPDPILMVIDSLDECDDAKMSSEIVRLLAQILRHCRWPLKVLFTSRAEPHILQMFRHPELCDMTCSLQLQDFGVSDDIRVYLRHSFEEIQESSRHVSRWPSEDEIEMIVQKAAGLFIFATMVVKYVGVDYGSPVARLQTVLQALQDSASAESYLILSPLDSLYLDTLRMIPGSETVRLVLGFIVFAFRPLSIHGLNDLHWRSQLDVPYVVKNLCSVLVISDAGADTDGAVRIYHTSFRDFLTNPHRSQQYFVDHVVFHGILARACLELMNQHLRADMCNLGDPSLLNREIEGIDKRCKLHIKEGVRYACRWFGYHVSQVSWDSDTDNALIISLQEFANQRLFNWIEVLSLTGELDSAVLSLREVTDWLKRSPKPYEEVLSLFSDAERLLLMCYDSTHQAALQVYYSLPCVPACAQIRATYSDQLENKFLITHGLDDHWNLCLRSVFTGGAIKSLAISAPGRLIASAGAALGVQLWDTLTGSKTGHFCGKGDSTCPVIFSPSGDFVAVGYDTGTIDVWDVSTGQQLLEPSQDPHETSVVALAFSRDSFFIASGAADGTVHVWDVSAGSLKHSFAYHRGPVLRLLFSFDAMLIASCSEDTSIITCNAHVGKLARKFEGHVSKVNSISFSPDNGRIASGSDDQTVRLWDTRTGVCLRTFARAHSKPIRQVWVTADNRNVVSVCDFDIYMWEMNSPSRKSPRHVWSFGHYFRKAATMFPAWYAKIARLLPANMVARIAEVDDGVHAVSSPDGMAIGLIHESSVFFLDLSARRKRRWPKVLATSSAMDEPPLYVDGSDDSFTGVAMSLDTAVLVTSMDNGIIQIWNTSLGNNWKTFQNTFKRVIEGFWPAPDGRSFLVKPMVGLQLFVPASTVTKDLETGGDVLEKVGAVTSPDSRYFAYWARYPWNLDRSCSIHIYNSSTGARLVRIPGLFNITCGRFSSESNLFACAHGEGAMQVWESPFAHCRVTIMTGHTSITALEILPGNITFIMGSDQGDVEIRLIENGDPIHRVSCSPAKVLALAVPKETLVVIVGHEDGSVFLWVPSCNAAPHCLLPKMVDKTSEEDANDPDGVDFITFMEGYRSICTRSVKGVICTFDLIRCLTDYTEREQETVKSAAANATSTVSADGSTRPEALGTQDATEVPTAGGSTLPDSQNDSSKPTSTPPQTTLEDNASDKLGFSSSCPHFVSRSDGDIVYDRYMRSTYSVDGREGWVYRGSRRMFWLPNDLRPASPTALAAFEDTLVILTRARPIVRFDLRPMVDPVRFPGGRDA